MAPSFMETMDSLRELIGEAIYVNSGFRCYSHNDSIPDSARQSYHTKGLALDIYCKVTSLRELGSLAEALGLNVIYYETFLHVDGRHL
jgi:uncharacterized protein YcbK (DUF882 family)